MEQQGEQQEHAAHFSLNGLSGVGMEPHRPEDPTLARRRPGVATPLTACCCLTISSSRRDALMKPTLLILTATIAAAPGVAQTAASPHPGDTQMSGNQRDNDTGTAGKKPKSKDDTVLTPAGPVRKENVHPVAPNEEVRRDKDGNLVVVPRQDQTERK
jgi:hypothetical protein